MKATATASEIAAAVKAGEIKARQVVAVALKRIEAHNPMVGAFTDVTVTRALEQADRVDDKLAAGIDPGPLAGVPFAVKNLFDIKGVVTRAGSRLNRANPPAEQDATLIQRLEAAGAVLVGGLNMGEYAYDFTGENAHDGPSRNPHALDRMSGGSSGGSAAAVAAFLCAGATGTDTGGSIRQPAAFTGTVGIKPTYGRCSRWGIVAFASSLDQAGPFARTVNDAAILLRSMAGYDPKDSTCVNRPVPDYEEAVGASIKGKKIGIPREYRMDGMADEIDTLWREGAKWLEEAGAEIVDISLPHTQYALPAYYIVAPAEASSNLARYDGVRYGARVPGKDVVEMYENTRAAGFGPEVRRRIMIGTYVLSAGYYDAYYLRAQKVRSLIKRDFDLAFAQGVDAVLTPATPSPAFGIGEKLKADPVEMYLNDVFTVTVNMAGLPGISVPAGLSADGLPLGLQLIGRPFEEETLFSLAEVIEEAAGRFPVEDLWWKS